LRTAHDAVISQFKVNFSNISASRLVAKLRDDNHNCWGSCADNAKVMQDAIEKWNEAIKSTGVTTKPTNNGILTDETRTLEMEFADSANPNNTNSIKLNVEAAMLKAPMIRSQSPAGPYLWVPTVSSTTLTSTDPNAGSAFMNFTAPVTGEYNVWGLVQGASDADNSFYVNVSDSTRSWTGDQLWEFPADEKFKWSRAANQRITLNLKTENVYTLEMRQREDGAKISSLIITMDKNFDSSNVNEYLGKTLSFNLSNILKVPDVVFQIDVVDFDVYTYKFSKPRIKTNGTNVYAKGIKLLVNDIYSPQHSTYTMVDKIATPTDGILSTYSMIVLKDKGMSGDHIRFSFDNLSITNGGGTTGGAGGSTGGGTGQTSLMAFQNTVYPISRSSTNSCVGCHMTRTPRHASDNAQTAHDDVLNVVDFNNPSNSRIVNKMRVQRHNCGANCEQLATAYEKAIADWKTMRQP
jgi:hypothetical protein